MNRPPLVDDALFGDLDHRLRRPPAPNGQNPVYGERAAFRARRSGRDVSPTWIRASEFFDELTVYDLTGRETSRRPVASMSWRPVTTSRNVEGSGTGIIKKARNSPSR